MTETDSVVQAETSRAERWEEWTAWPLLLLAIGFLALSTVVLADNGIDASTQNWATVGLFAIWALFLLDFAVRLFLTRDRWRYVRLNSFEVVTLVIPFLRAFLLVLYIWRLPALKRSRTHQRLRFMLVAASLGLVFVYVASTLVWLVEHQAAGANITSFGDAIWWGFATIATVGYGDYTPVTVPGRVIAVILMLGGIVIVGIVTATVISSLTEQVQREAAKRNGGPRSASEIGTEDLTICSDRGGLNASDERSGRITPPPHTASTGDSQRGEANQDGDLQP